MQESSSGEAIATLTWQHASGAETQGRKERSAECCKRHVDVCFLVAMKIVVLEKDSFE